MRFFGHCPNSDWTSPFVFFRELCGTYFIRKEVKVKDFEYFAISGVPKMALYDTLTAI